MLFLKHHATLSQAVTSAENKTNL